jgi:ribosome-associated protein
MDDKKAESICILDVRKLTVVADYFVIASVNSQPHMRAVWGSVEESLRAQENVVPVRRDGVPGTSWGVLDYGGMVMHIMEPHVREIYNLERIWAEAKRIPWRARQRASSHRERAEGSSPQRRNKP